MDGRRHGILGTRREPVVEGRSGFMNAARSFLGTSRTNPVERHLIPCDPVVADFANEVAARYSMKPMNVIARVLPAAWRERGMPKDPADASAIVRDAARALAENHLATAPAPGLSGALAVSARVMALQKVLDADLRRDPDATVQPFSADLRTAMRHLSGSPEYRRPGPVLSVVDDGARGVLAAPVVSSLRSRQLAGAASHAAARERS